MGNLAGRALQRAALETSQTTRPTPTQTATGVCEAPLDGIAGLEDATDGSSSDSMDSLGKCEAGRRGKRRRDDGSNRSEPEVGRRQKLLARSLSKRNDTPDFAPFGGPLMRERPALVPDPVATAQTAATLDANFIVGDATENGGSSERACDRCAHVKKKCDGKTPCALCIKCRRKCIRSVPRRRNFSDDSSPPRTSGGRNSGGCGSHGEECLPPRCRHEGCPQPPLHGRRGGRPLWCQLHVVSQSSDQPKRCSVLQRTNSGNFLACWKETEWGWPGKPPNRCEGHRAEGQQQQEVVEVVSLLKDVFAQVLWPTLRRRGWRQETIYCGSPYSSPYSLWMPPNVSRGTKPFRARIDYFDTQHLVIKYCLRTEEHHGWLMREYRHLKAQRSTRLGLTGVDSGIPKPCEYVQPPDMSSCSGKNSTQRIMHSQNKRTEKIQCPSPAKVGGFTHQLFSTTLVPKRAKRDGSDGSGGGSYGACKVSPPAGFETRLREKLDHLGLQQPHARAQPLHTSHRAVKLKALGLDSTLVAKMGLVYSERAMTGFLARMGGGCGSTGGPMAALAASLLGFDASALAQDVDVASASSSTSKRDSSDMYYAQLKQSPDLESLPASGDQSHSGLQTYRDGVIEPAAKRRATSERAMTGFLARMGGGCRGTGGPMAALAASLLGFDASALAQDVDVASASNSTSKRGSSDMYYAQLKPSPDLEGLPASGDQCHSGLQTYRDGVVESAAKRRATEEPRQKEAGAPAHHDGSSSPRRQILPQQAEALALAQIRLMCDSTAPGLVQP